MLELPLQYQLLPVVSGAHAPTEPGVQLWPKPKATAGADHNAIIKKIPIPRPHRASEDDNNWKAHGIHTGLSQFALLGKRRLSMI